MALNSRTYIPESRTNSQFIWMSFQEKFSREITSVLSHSQKNNYKLPNETLAWFSDEEFIQFLIKKEISELNISLLNWTNKERLNRILTGNFPLLEISRLVSWDKLLNVNISWIKQINDIAGADFCDKVILKFKEILRSQFTKSSKNSTHKWRIVKDDYKNITFETRSENALESIFWEITSKKEIIKIILSALEKDIQNNARNILQNQIQNWHLTFTSQTHFEELITQEVEKTKFVILKYFDFWVWESIIPENAQDLEKLDAIRQAEISSRPENIKNDTISLKKYSSHEILWNLANVLQIETEIIEKFKGKKFSFDQVDYNIVFYKNGKSTLSSEALRYVRKYPDKITPKEFSEMLQLYLKSLNSSLDFISPVKDELKNGWNEFELARHIDGQIKSWTLHTHFLTHSYKWWLTKTAFFESVQGKNGVKVFIDIKDMWIDNLMDFNLRAKQIVKLSQDFQAWKIDQKTFEEKQAKILLESGKSVSDKFIEIQRRIQSQYPNAFISFGGDEIYLFIENIDTQASENLNRSLTHIFSATNQKARIVIDTTQKTLDSRGNFSQLEKITKLNKILEETIEKQLTKKWISLPWNIPENTYIRIHENLRKKLLSSDFHMDDFFAEVKDIIAQKNLIDGGNKQIQLWKTTSGIDIYLKKDSNNEIEIYLTNTHLWAKK